MSDINFDCPKCGQNLDAPRDMAGLFVECPSCATIIKVPTAPGASSSFHEEDRVPDRPEFVTPAKQEDKGTTMRIDIPSEFRMPPPTTRKFNIKRAGR